MFKTIIFDFDGVIAESVDVKTMAFRELFKGHPDKLTLIEKYHLDNGGLSRFDKFRHIYKNIIGQPLSEDKFAELCLNFNKLVIDKVVNAEYVKGAKEFLDYWQNKYRIYIVSGTPEIEIREIVKRRGLEKYFAGVYGSPENKTNLINAILEKNGWQGKEALFIGDSKNDFTAASETSVVFAARSLELDADWLKSPEIKIIFSNLAEFKKYFIEHLES